RTSAAVSLKATRQNMAVRKKTVRTKRARVSLFGKFIQTSFDSPAVMIGPGDGKPGRPSPGSWLGTQIVIGMTDDLHAREPARPQPASHVNAAIDVRRVRFAAGNIKISGPEVRVAVGAGAKQAVLP